MVSASGGLVHWLRIAVENGEPDPLESALNRMRRRGIAVSAEDADKALGLNPGTTLFFNHGGTVPPEALLDELERRYPNRARDCNSGRPLDQIQETRNALALLEDK